MNPLIVTNFLLHILVLVFCMEYDFVFATTDDGGIILRCVARERKALLKFKEGLVDDYGMMSSWGKEKECCKWEGVECNNNTGRVIALRLAGHWPPNRYYLGGEIHSSLLELHNLNVLDMSVNDFGNIKFPEFICSMSNLQYLNLSWSKFSAGTLPSRLWNLTSLKTLDLSTNQFNGTLPSEIGKLTNLQTLDLAYNNFSGTLPSEIGDLTNLETLDLSSNGFSGTVPSEIGNLINLVTLDFSNNGFSGTLTPQLWTLPNLKTLDLSENYLTSSNTDSFSNMSTNHVAHSLKTLDLRSNKLKKLPSSIWQLLKLEELRVSYNSLEDTITEADLSKLPNLKQLDLSSNSLSLNISPDWNPPFQLSDVILSGCKVGPNFPLWIRTQTNFTSLDLSLNGLLGEVPKWISSLSHEISYLNLSHNRLTGNLTDFSSMVIKVIDVSSNNFSGSIPLFSQVTFIFQMSQNMLSGSLSFNCGVSYTLSVLDLSDNQLSGKLPNCWGNMIALLILNLANNHFSGEIPHSLGNLSNLMTLQLSNNNFSGELPSTLKNCRMLQFVDIGDNMLTGSIPTWIGEYRENMVYLIIPNNRFHGIIPPQICYLSQIQVLDLSGNDISGEIPPCFHNFTYFVEKNISTDQNFPLLFAFSYHVIEVVKYTIVSWKHNEHKYERNLVNLKLIDLSRNRLVGNIPRSFSSLKGLRSLNLSRNSLTGIIDPDIGRMELLESLDLSSNQLFGAIPISMEKLNFLGVLDLANNNLSGKIPVGSQLQTFPASTYAGNIGLCGSPLPPCSRDSPDPSTNNIAENVDDDGSILSLSFLKEIGIPIIVGFVVGFWGVVGSLIVNESWRRVFYNFWGAVGDWFYVRATIFRAKLFRRN